MTIGKGYKDYVVTALRPAIPRTVLTDEHSVGIGDWQAIALCRNHAQRCNVRPQGKVRNDGQVYLFRTRWHHPRIDMLAIVAIRPTIETTITHRRQVVGHQIAAQFLTLVDHDPQLAGGRFPCHAVGVAQSRGKDTCLTTASIHFPDRCPSLLDSHATFGDVTVRADGHVKPTAVEAGNQVFRPVMVDLSGRQRYQATTRDIDMSITTGIRKT